MWEWNCGHVHLLVLSSHVCSTSSWITKTNALLFRRDFTCAVSECFQFRHFFTLTETLIELTMSLKSWFFSLFLDFITQLETHPGLFGVVDQSTCWTVRVKQGNSMWVTTVASFISVHEDDNCCIPPPSPSSSSPVQHQSKRKSMSHAVCLSYLQTRENNTYVQLYVHSINQKAECESQLRLSILKRGWQTILTN